MMIGKPDPLRPRLREDLEVLAPAAALHPPSEWETEFDRPLDGERQVRAPWRGPFGARPGRGWPYAARSQGEA